MIFSSAKESAPRPGKPDFGENTAAEAYWDKTGSFPPFYGRDEAPSQDEIRERYELLSRRVEDSRVPIDEQRQHAAEHEYVGSLLRDEE